MVLRGDMSDYFTVYEYGRTTAKKVYFFGGWRGRPVYFKPVVRWLVGHGYAVVLLIPKRKLVAVGTPYSELVIANQLAVAEVRHRIAVDKMIGVREFISLGISLGTLFATELAKDVPEISKLVL